MSNDLSLLDRLTTEERKAYEEYVESGRPPLSIQTSLQLYELFLQGSSCQDIAKIKTAFPLGMIVRARIDHGWDRRRQEHMDGLYEQVGGRIRQTIMESVNFVGDLMAVAHKLHGMKLKKFLITENPDDLGELNLFSFKQYKEAIEMLMKLSGSDNKKTVEHKGSVSVLTKPATIAQPLPPGQLPPRMTPAQADLMRIEMEKKEEGE